MNSTTDDFVSDTKMDEFLERSMSSIYV